MRINATESQLATLPTKRELLRARLLTDEGEQLLAQVDELIAGNAGLIEGNPVRTVRQLLGASEGSGRKRNKEDLVAPFLAQEPAAEQQVVRGQDELVDDGPGEQREPEKVALSDAPVSDDQSSKVDSPENRSTGEQGEGSAPIEEPATAEAVEHTIPPQTPASTEVEPSEADGGYSSIQGDLSDAVAHAKPIFQQY